MKVIADESLNLSSRQLQEIKDYIVYKLKSESWQIHNTGKEILLYDFAGPGISLFGYLSTLEKQNESGKFSKLIEVYKDFLETDQFMIDLHKKITTATFLFALELTSFDKRIVSPKVSYQVNKSEACIFIEVNMKSCPPDIVSVNIDGNIRPVFRIAITCIDVNPVWIDVNAGKLGLKHLPPETNLPVYIQNHAINRLKERIDSADIARIYLNLIHSLEELNCISYRGNILIEFYYFGQKIGYLLTDVIEHTVVIRTFLLLTHFDTPEGDALHRIIGLEKPDITHLNLDKLSTFVYSSIEDKALVNELFTRAGCDQLFKVEKQEFEKENFQARASMIETYILKYMQHHEEMEPGSLSNLFG